MGSSSTMRTRVMSAPRKQITYFQCNHSSVAIIMGLSAFFGSTGGAGDFLRLVRVDESSECRMASPWQFSPYSPSPSKCSAARSQWRRALGAIVQRGEAALAAIRDRDPEPALEPYAHGKAAAPVAIDRQDAPPDT